MAVPVDSQLWTPGSPGMGKTPTDMSQKIAVSRESRAHPSKITSVTAREVIPNGVTLGSKSGHARPGFAMSLQLISTLLACLAFGVGTHTSSSTQAHGRHSSQVTTQLSPGVLQALLRGLGFDPAVHCAGFQPADSTNEGDEGAPATEPDSCPEPEPCPEPPECPDPEPCPDPPTPTPDPSEPDKVAIFSPHAVWHGEGINYRICNNQEEDIEVTVKTENIAGEPQGSLSMIVPAKQGRNGALTFVVDGTFKEALAKFSSRVEIRYLGTHTITTPAPAPNTFCSAAGANEIMVTRAHHSPHFPPDPGRDTIFKSIVICPAEGQCGVESIKGGSGKADSGPHTH